MNSLGTHIASFQRGPSATDDMRGVLSDWGMKGWEVKAVWIDGDWVRVVMQRPTEFAEIPNARQCPICKYRTVMDDGYCHHCRSNTTNSVHVANGSQADLMLSGIGAPIGHKMKNPPTSKG